MADLVLRRIAIPNHATFGALIRPDGVPFALTLEREHDGGSNRPSTSAKAGACIPAGSYKCQRVDSPKFGRTFEVRNVPNRSHILFHAGNLAEDSRGCILVGETFDPVKGQDGITASKVGFAQFMATQAEAMEFTLTIVDP